MTQEKPSTGDICDIRNQRRALLLGVAVAFPMTGLLWVAVYLTIPPINAAELPVDRIVFAFGCIAVAILLGLVLAIEAVSHERLSGQAIDPLDGAESRRLKVNLRYLQNTLEQTVLFRRVS